MPTISFKAKIETVREFDGSIAWQFIKVPKITRSHCDMNAFRRHAKFGGLANSDLFPNLISRQLALHNVKEHIRLDRVPECVEIDDTGFLARVTITLDA